MRTLASIEEQSEQAKLRLQEILREIGQGFIGREHRAIELAEELAVLLHEQRQLQVSLIYFRETASTLMAAECSGPH